MPLELHFIFIFLFFSANYICIYEALKIYTAHRQWIKNSLQEQKNITFILREFPVLLSHTASLLNTGYALPQALKQLQSSRAGLILNQLLSKKKTEFRPCSSHGLLTFVKLAFEVSSKNGISLSPLLKHLSSMARDELRIQEKIKSMVLPIQIQCCIAFFLPWFVLLLFYFIDHPLMIRMFHHYWGIMGCGLAFMLDLTAYIWIKNLYSIKQDLLFVEFSLFLEMMSLFISAGLDFTNALKTLLEHLPLSALQERIKFLASYLKIGSSREEAVHQLQKEWTHPYILHFCQTLLFGWKQGISMSHIFHEQALWIREETLFSFERKIQKLQFKLLLPLFCCVLPSVLIMLMLPFLIEFL